MLSIGTRSLLRGAHHWWWHARDVYRAWCWLYGRRPRLSETIAIALHDVGYIGAEDMDGTDGTFHPYRSAKVVARLAGLRAAELVKGHSQFLCTVNGTRPSLLCWADKLGTAMWLLGDPADYIRRTRATGELAEYRARADRSGFMPMAATDEEWAATLGWHLAQKALLGAPSVSLSRAARCALVNLRGGRSPLIPRRNP